VQPPTKQNSPLGKYCRHKGSNPRVRSFPIIWPLNVWNDNVWLQSTTPIVSTLPGPLAGQHWTLKTLLLGPPGRSMRPFSSPNLFLMDMMPLARPRIKYCPSFVQEQPFTRAEILYFCTAFWSADQKAKSDKEQEARWWETGLKLMHWMESPWLWKNQFFKIKY